MKTGHGTKLRVADVLAAWCAPCEPSGGVKPAGLQQPTWPAWRGFALQRGWLNEEQQFFLQAGNAGEPGAWPAVLGAHSLLRSLGGGCLLVVTQLLIQRDCR
jgi:hypothetical protein